MVTNNTNILSIENNNPVKKSTQIYIENVTNLDVLKNDFVSILGLDRFVFLLSQKIF